MTYFNEDVYKRSPDAAFLDITDANAYEKPSEVCGYTVFVDWEGLSLDRAYESTCFLKS